MKILLKTILCAACLFGATSTAMAGETALKLSLRNGTSPIYVLSDKPVASFDGDKIVFTVNNASTSYPRSEVVNITFIEDAASLKEIVVENEETMRFIDRTVEAEGRTITVYGVDGRPAASGRDKVDLKNLAPGIYIATAGNQTLKIKL